MNQGFDAAEIKMLREECKQAGMNYVYCEDEDVEMSDNGELVHVQFVGVYKTKDVIYDAIIYTLRLHHSSLVYEKAVEQVRKIVPSYLPVDERGPNYKISAEDEEEAEELIAEIMEAIEDEEDIKVKEHLDIDPDFEYGVSLDVCLNVEAVTEEVVEKFVNDFNKGTLRLDPTLYSFSSLEGEED